MYLCINRITEIVWVIRVKSVERNRAKELADDEPATFPMSASAFFSLTNSTILIRGGWG